MTPKNDKWLSNPPAFPLEIDDVGLIIKTGFSTRERLVAQLDGLQEAHVGGNVVLVGDYSTVSGGLFRNDDLEIPVYDVLDIMVESGSLSSRLNASRLQHYYNLTAALSSGNFELAHTIGEMYGWEMDIMKHISGLQLGYKLMPSKKWYVMLDDDTYILDGSLKSILGHLNPSLPYYIGNAIGDYKARFAHGGSAVVFSQEAMNRIFIQNPAVVAEAHLESLDARWGDKLIATTAMKCGIYLDEKYDRYFNGEAPQITRLRGDRFCAPLISFHKMSPAQMLGVGRIFKNISNVVSWIDIWKIYGAPTLDGFPANPFRSNWDHVGKVDEATMTTNGVMTKEDCLGLCHIHSSTCLSWTWDAESKACHIGPWMIVGYPSGGRVTGVNVPRAIRLLDECPS
ncbi:hypothetical protein EAF04_009164 [Stromatinia cepivora]|nr:hypothetical protein EAF04_009164 [Stromatinia cepivora]